MRDVSLWRGLLGVENAVIERVEYDEDVEVLVAHVRPTKRARGRCTRTRRTVTSSTVGRHLSGSCARHRVPSGSLAPAPSAPVIGLRDPTGQHRLLGSVHLPHNYQAERRRADPAYTLNL